VDALKYQPATPDGAPRFLGEAMTVKLRYKQPRDSHSQEFAVSGPYSRSPIASASADLRFAAGVAEFGMALKDSRDKGSSSFEGAIARLASALDDDPDGRKAELMYLVKTARSLKLRK